MHFHIKGVNKQALIVSLTLEASSETDALLLAEQQQVRVLAIRSKQTWSLGRWRPREAFPLLLFSQELATLLNAGLALIDALESLAEKESTPRASEILSGLVRQLYEGKSFSLALGKFPADFPPLYIALIQSSEKTGTVGESLERYVSYHRRMDEIRQKILSASLYPILLFIVGCGVLLFLIGYVVPRFSLVFEGVGSELPWLSQMLLRAGQFLNQHQAGMFGGLMLVIVASTILLRQDNVRQAIVRLINKVPTIRRRLFVYELARFYRSLGILLQGGIPILTAMNMVRGLLGIMSRQQLDQAILSIQEGHALSESLAQKGLTTPVALRMLRAGERSGNLGEMMERTADFYDEENNRWVEWFVRLFEPLLMTFIGLLIGVIVVLMYMPIFDMASSIQ
ncbi:general secretion pathway protein F [Oceanisphaera litoralis]|uniref:type II secretion system F family protein n=1 Tax=Oceanisphaera litoralis TaxID=225144 RepID=UPI00195CAAD5|nr:type II secretion system F family protein [Oceanisphaera litoralis]MBM7455972.1 general secretion pathway protein F [Oceanisphaera litoralis]